MARLKRFGLALPVPLQEWAFRGPLRHAVSRIESSARLRGIDWEGTRAFSEEVNTLPAIWLNVRGRDPQGVVSSGAEYERLLAEILTRVTGWRDRSTGQKVISRAWPREELYRGVAVELAPDIVLEPALDRGYSYTFLSSGGRPGPAPTEEARQQIVDAGERGEQIAYVELATATASLSPVTGRTAFLLGGLIGLLGLVFVFWTELISFDLSSGRALGLTFAICATLSASLGNIVAARNQRSGLPVLQSNTLGMTYGTIFTLLLVLFQGTKLTFDPSAPYVISLVYLALFGSVIAFGTYLTLLGRIGPGRAAYVSILFQIVALVLSTIYEDLIWNLQAVFGVILILAGNVIALSKISTRTK